MNKYKWSNKKLEGSKMVRYCQNADLPRIICNKDETYTVEVPGAKPMTYKEWEEAVKKSVELGKKAKKAVRKFEKENAND